jgi:hypothetical protein
MTVLIAVHDSWSTLDPAGMGRLLAMVKTLEAPCPAPPPPSPSSVAETLADGDLGELLAGMDEPEPPAALPTPARFAAAPPPTSGQALYRWACRHDLLPNCNAIGKRNGWPKMLTQWSQERVAEAYRELTTSSPANGKVP